MFLYEQKIIQCAPNKQHICYSVIVNSVLFFGAVCWSGNINNLDRIRLDTFIKKANGTVRMERVMDRVQKVSGRCHTLTKILI